MRAASDKSYRLSPWPMQIRDSLLIITSIQSSTLFHCFSLSDQTLFVFFCFGICLGFLCVNHILFSWFLTVLSQILTPVSTLFFSICLVHFLFSRHIALRFLFWQQCHLPWSPSISSFCNAIQVYILAPHFRNTAD